MLDSKFLRKYSAQVSRLDSSRDAAGAGNIRRSRSLVQDEQDAKSVFRVLRLFTENSFIDPSESSVRFGVSVYSMTHPCFFRPLSLVAALCLTSPCTAAIDSATVERAAPDEIVVRWKSGDPIDIYLDA